MKSDKNLIKYEFYKMGVKNNTILVRADFLLLCYQSFASIAKLPMSFNF